MSPADMIAIAQGVRYRQAKAYDLAAWAITTLINFRGGVWLKKGKKVKVKDLLGREPMGVQKETPEDRAARKASLLALHRKVSKKDKRG